MGKKHQKQKDQKIQEKAGNKPKWSGKGRKAKQSTSLDYLVTDSFSQTLHDQNGLVIHRVLGDGNCLFRSIAHQLFGSDTEYMEVRADIISYMKARRDHFGLFIEDDEPFDDYITRMSDNGEWGGNQEIFAASQCFCINICIYQEDHPMWLTMSEVTTERRIHISYHGECHYNSLESASAMQAPLPPLPSSGSSTRENTQGLHLTLSKLTLSKKVWHEFFLSYPRFSFS